MIFDMPGSFVMTFLFILGCCIGSFLNVCIHRFPSKIRLWDQLKALNSHGSGCPRCAAAIKWRDNIPLLGWLLLGGKCRNCRRPISMRYPLVELLTGVLFVVVYQAEMPPNFWDQITEFGISSAEGPQTIANLFPVTTWLHVRYAMHIAMICCLIVATFIDFELRIIPDGSTVPMMLCGLVVSAACGQTFLVPLWFQDASVVATLKSVSPGWLNPFIFSWDYLPFATAYPHLHGLLVSLAGLLVGGGIVWLVRIAGFWVLKQEAMGFGDVVLMAMIGSVVGWQPVTVIFFMAPVLAIFAAIFVWLTKRDREIPYGPWLSLATLLLLLFWPIVWPRAERIFDMGPFVPLMALFMFVSLIASLQLIQLVKRFFGINTASADSTAETGWSSADHLMFYNAERPDEQTGQWNRTLWPGSRAGQGTSIYHQWRNGRDR
jgi:leader peptidase (prepilin peptidase)/N-methyltransferase